MSKIALAATSALAITIVAAPAGAVELVTNGSFEQGTSVGNVAVPTGWTTGGSGDLAGRTASARTGIFSYGFLATNGQTNTLSQTLSTTVGGSYTFSFWLKNLVAGQDFFQAFFGNQLVFDLTTGRVASPFAYTQFTYSVVAQSTSTTISFAGYDGPSGIFLDDVSVDGATAAPGVPEPATWAMMLAGFGLVGAGLRRRRVAFA